jgi:hypothetical protein
MCLCLVCFYLTPRKWAYLPLPEGASHTPRVCVYPTLRTSIIEEYSGSKAPNLMMINLGKVSYTWQRLLPSRPLFQNGCPNLNVKWRTLFSLKVVEHWKNCNTHSRLMLSWESHVCVKRYVPEQCSHGNDTNQIVFLPIFLDFIPISPLYSFFIRFSFIFFYFPHCPSSSAFASCPPL